MRIARTCVSCLIGALLTLAGCTDTVHPPVSATPPAEKPPEASRPPPAVAANGARPATTSELQNELNTAVRQLESTRSENVRLRADLDKLRTAQATLAASLEQDAARPLTRPQAPAAALPGDVDAALQAFADRSAGRVTYDRAQAAVSFANDRLFASGQDAIDRDGRKLLDEFAAIAARTAPAAFELIVVGHTDNSPITGGSSARHATNWHLSVHRAIAVKDVLVSAGIPENRIGVMGYGAFRPLGGDRALDRRVEIFLAPKGQVSARGPIRP